MLKLLSAIIIRLSPVALLLIFVNHQLLSSVNLFSTPTNEILGRPGSTARGPWSLFSNPAAIAGIQSPVAGAGYMNSFHLRELGSGALFAIVPTRVVTAGVGISRFGFSNFSMQQFSFIAGREMAPWLWMGTRFNYHSKQQALSSTRRVVSFDAGIRLVPTNELIVGVYLINPAQARWNLEGFQEYLPVQVATSLNYKPPGNIELEVGIAKEMNRSPEISAYIGIPVVKDVELRGALSSNPMRLGVGSGVRWTFIVFDVGFNHHPYLGYSSSFGMIFCIRGIKQSARP